MFFKPKPWEIEIVNCPTPINYDEMSIEIEPSATELAIEANSRMLKSILKNQTYVEERLVRIESKVHLIGEALNIKFKKPE